MALLEEGRRVADRWQLLEEGEAQASPILLPYARFVEARKHWLALNNALGVVFPNDLDPSLLAEDLERLSLVVLQFPAFRDGRAYSQARLLRERHGYRGTLRASGDILIDQYFFMKRCGFDSFEVPDDADIKAWEEAAAKRTTWYQPSGGLEGENILLARHKLKSGRD